MLVLSRKKNETIVIGDGDNPIRITVVELRGDKVRIGIQADAHVPVHREEVWRAIHNQPPAEPTDPLAEANAFLDGPAHEKDDQRD